MNNLYVSPELSFDPDGFTPSFDLEEATTQSISEFYHKYGFVVYRNILTQAQINSTIDELWNEVGSFWKEMSGDIIDRNDPNSWNAIKGFPKKFGFANDDILRNAQFWKNRQNQKVYRSFKITYEGQTKKKLSEPLLACLDRGSIMRPTTQNPEWKTQNFYHFDIDPWLWVGLSKRMYTKYDYDEENSFYMMGEGNYTKNVGYTKLAGVLALSDTNENSGGFECAFGFQNYIKQWCEENKINTRITDDQNLVKNFKKIFLRKGSLLIFSRQLPHNIYPNNSGNFRYAQYLRMTPESSLDLDKQEKEKRKKLIKKLLPKEIDVSDPISKQIFMLD